MLCLDGEARGVLFGHLVLGPRAIEQIQSELTSKDLLDHLALRLPAPRGANLHRAQDLLVDRQRGPHLRHICIMAS
jgi:hypothetical protein